MRRSLLLLWALVAAIACWRLDPVHRPLTGDNQLYFYLAERAASGVPPHVSHVDPKNQLGVLITATAMSAGRPVGIDDVVASRVVSIAFAATSVVLAAELATVLAGSAAAGHVAALALLAARGFVDHSAVGSNPKIFLVAFVLLAHVAMAADSRRGQGVVPGFARHDALAGMAAGAAFLCWQPALLVLAAVAFEALVGRHGSLRRALSLLAAALVPVVGYELYFLAHGALGEQLHQAYEMTLGSVHQPAGLQRSVAFVFTEATRAWMPPRIGPISFALLGAALLVRLAWSPRSTVAAMRERAGALSVALGATGATAFTLYDHQGVPDLFFPDPYFAVAAGLLVATVMRAVGRVAARPAATLLALAMSAALIVQMQRNDGVRRAPGYDLADQRRAADVLRDYREATGSVWVYGAVHLLGLAHLDNHVPYGLFYDDVESVLDVDAYLPLHQGRMPEVIVHARETIPGAGRYLGTDYFEAPSEGLAPQSLRIWRRSDNRGPVRISPD